VPIACAFYNNASAMHFFTIGGEEINSHFGPLGDRLVSAKFDAIGTNFDRFRGKRKASLGAVHMHRLEDAGPVEFASAHIG